MATKKLLPGFKYLGGKSQRYLNTETGEEFSRRQYDKLASPGLSYEKKAAHNKLINPKAAILKPARGRKSYINAPEWVKDEIAEQRLEAEKLKKEAEEKAKEAASNERKIQRLIGKKVKIKQVKKHLIPPGQIGWRLAFNTYSDLVKMVHDAKRTGVIFAYALGYAGVNTQYQNKDDIAEPAIWVKSFMSINNLISEKDFNDLMEAAVQARAYIKFKNYFVQFAIDKGHAAKTLPKKKPIKRKGKGRGRK